MTNQENQREIEAERQYAEKYRKPIQDFLEFSSQLEGKLTADATFHIDNARELLPSMLEKDSRCISNTSGHICACLKSERDIRRPQDYTVNSERYKLITQAIKYLTDISETHAYNKNRSPNLRGR